MKNPGVGQPLRDTATQLFNWQLVLWPMVSIVLMALAALFIIRIPHIDQYVIWLATTVGILFFSTVILVVADRRVADSVQETKDIYIKSFQAIEKDIRKFVEPTVNFQNSRTLLRMSMTPILIDFYKGGETYLHILGADLLAPSRDRLEKLKESGAPHDEDLTLEDVAAEISYGDAYYQIFQAATDKNVRRYIRLFTGSGIIGRTDDFKTRYMDWLEAQYMFIRTMANYALVDTPRAIPWGAPKSTMILGDTIAEIFFTPAGPTGGIILTSDTIVPATQIMLIDEYVNDPNVKPEPITVYTRANVEEFRDHVNGIIGAIQNPDKFLIQPEREN